MKKKTMGKEESTRVAHQKRKGTQNHDSGRVDRGLEEEGIDRRRSVPVPRASRTKNVGGTSKVAGKRDEGGNLATLRPLIRIPR